MNRTRRTTIAVAALTIASMALSLGDAFTLSMVATRYPQVSRPRVPPSTNKTQRRPQQQSSGVTSSLISNLAVVALKLRLKDQSHVSCDVTASSSRIFSSGQVGPVTVRGRSWQSPLGLLTCRAIEATVETCHLDMSRILSQQKLVLTTPAKGNAMVALNSEDFGSFITHPLMKPPGLSNDGEGIKFMRDNVHMDTSSGRITFYGEYMYNVWKCTLERGSHSQQRALVTVVPHETNEEDDELHATSAELTRVVSSFFNEMVFELDGTFLSFRDMQLTDKGGAPSVMLALGITVKKFPSPGLAF